MKRLETFTLMPKKEQRDETNDNFYTVLDVLLDSRFRCDVFLVALFAKRDQYIYLLCTSSPNKLSSI